MIIRKFCNFHKPISILLIFSIFLIFSCSTDNSITGGSNQTNLNKPTDIGDISNTNSDDDGEYDFFEAMEYIWKSLSNQQQHVCVFFLPGILPNPYSSNLSKAYDFRDNYLSKSKKGNGYITAYYILSNYSIENNLIMKYSSEHLELMNTGLDFSRELQHGTDDNKILINKSTYDALKDIVKIYRESENHTDIDPVLDYLETDLGKYYNKTKAEIAVDFK